MRIYGRQLRPVVPCGLLACWLLMRLRADPWEPTSSEPAPTVRSFRDQRVDLGPRPVPDGDLAATVEEGAGDTRPHRAEADDGDTLGRFIRMVHERAPCAGTRNNERLGSLLEDRPHAARVFTALF